MQENPGTERADYARRVLVTGGTGFIGSALIQRLLADGIEACVLTRDRERARRQFDDRVTAYEDLFEIDDDEAPDVIVNLAGKGLESERWNPRVKREIVDSRVGTTHHVVDYIAQATTPPRLLISGSAVGYYGARGDTPMSEEDEPADEFQSRLCRQWEAAAGDARRHGVRVCISRTGVVLGPGGGMLAGLLPMFRRGMGAIAGSGRQWISWIHLDDLVDLFVDFMADETLAGAYNNTAPVPVTNREFSRTLGGVLNRPVILRAPAWALRLIKGEMARLYVTGQRVIPSRHIAREHVFRFPHLKPALENVLRRWED